MLDPLLAAASASAAAPATAVVVAAPGGPQTTVLLALLALFLIYFGPPLLRVALKPERGSALDLRIAWFETFVNDVEKRTKVTEKLAALAKLPPAVTAALPPPPLPAAERPTLPPAIVPPGPTTDDILTPPVSVPIAVPTEKEEAKP